MTRTKIRTNVVYKHLCNSDKKIIVEQGGTRSGKTYNILLWIIFKYCELNQNKTITICRKTFPAVRGTVMRDFFDILRQHNLYYEELRRRSDNEYLINTNRNQVGIQIDGHFQHSQNRRTANHPWIHTKHGLEFSKLNVQQLLKKQSACCFHY